MDMQLPLSTMAGAPWNVLDATGRRVALFHGNDLQGDPTPHDAANAEAVVEALRDRARLLDEKAQLVKCLDHVDAAYGHVLDFLNGDPQDDDEVTIPFKLMENLHWAFKEARHRAFASEDSPGRRGLPAPAASL